MSVTFIPLYLERDTRKRCKNYSVTFELPVEIPIQLHLELEVNLLVHNVIEREIEREKVQMKPPIVLFYELSIF